MPRSDSGRSGRATRSPTRLPRPPPRRASGSTLDPGDRSTTLAWLCRRPGRPAHGALRPVHREQTLRLPADDVPFTGRIASLENQPLKGVTVEVVRVANPAEGT